MLPPSAPWRRPGPSLYPSLGEYLCLATGGSSGRRGVFASDAAAIADSAAFSCGPPLPAAPRSPATFHPVPPGTPSARVLVTNLYNRVQPLIRYELTDSFTRQPDARQHGGHLRAVVEGRSDEVLRFKNADIHPLVLRSVLVASPAVSDYQVQQTPAGITVAVQGDQPSDLGALRGRLRSALARAGLPDPDVRIDAVPLLPRDPETGKLRRFIPA